MSLPWHLPGSMLKIALLALVSLLLLAYLLWLEFKRNSAQGRWVRVAAIVGVVIGLLLLGLQPQQKASSNVNELIISTPGASSAQLDSLQKRYPAAELLDTSLSSNDLLSRHHNPAALHLVGEGLPAYTLQAWAGVPMEYTPGSEPQGFVWLTLPQEPEVGAPIPLQGAFTGDKPVVLRWRGASGQLLDSCQLAAGHRQPFTLLGTFNTAGPQLTELEVVVGAAILKKESLAVWVKDVTHLKLLLLSSSPTFEARFLRDWAAAQGHRVLARRLVSRNKFASDYLNTPAEPLQRLSPALLAGLDIIYTDPGALHALDATEHQLLQQAVTQGLGVILALDAQNPTELALPLPAPFNQMPVTSSLRPQVDQALVLQGVRAQKLPPLPLAAARLASVAATQQLVSTPGGEAAACYQVLGLGKLTLSLIAATYPLQLTGKNPLYSALWRQLLQPSARPSKRTLWRLQTTAGMPYPDEPLTIHCWTTTAVPKVHYLLGDSLKETLSLQAVPGEQQHWVCTYWPWQVGWHRFKLAQDSSAYAVYVYPPTAWPGLRSAALSAATAQFAQEAPLMRHPLTTLKSLTTHSRPDQTVSPWGFWALLLLSLTVLWLEAKLNPRQGR